LIFDASGKTKNNSDNSIYSGNVYDASGNRVTAFDNNNSENNYIGDLYDANGKQITTFYNNNAYPENNYGKSDYGNNSIEHSTGNIVGSTFNGLGNAVGNTVDGTGNVIGRAVDGTGNVIGRAVDGTGNVIGRAYDAVTSGNGNHSSQGEFNRGTNFSRGANGNYMGDVGVNTGYAGKNGNPGYTSYGNPTGAYPLSGGDSRGGGSTGGTDRFVANSASSDFLPITASFSSFGK